MNEQPNPSLVDQWLATEAAAAQARTSIEARFNDLILKTSEVANAPINLHHDRAHIPLNKGRAQWLVNELTRIFGLGGGR